MTSLLSPFHFGQKYAYFHVRITIHELVNVPLVTGHFKARWRVKNAHGLQNIPGAIVPSSQGESSQQQQQHERDQGSVDEFSERKPLHHKKSFNSIASQDKSIKSGLSSQNDLSLHPDDETHPRERKTSNRFLAGFKEAFHTKGRRSTSGMHQASLHEELTPDHHSSSPAKSKDGAQTEDGKATKKGTSMESSRMVPTGSESVRSFAAESDNSHKRASYHSGKSREEREAPSLGSAAAQQASFLLQAEPRGETMTEKVREHVVRWERQLEVGVRIPIEKQRLNDKSSSNTPAATTSGALTPSGHSETGLSGTANFSATSNRNSMSNKESAQNLRSKLSHRSLADDRKSETESKTDRLEREHKDKDKDKELADAWGMLAGCHIPFKIDPQETPVPS